MKVTNYYYGYYNKFDCVMHGKITMSYKEWAEAMKWLYQEFKKSQDHFFFDIFIDDVNKRVPAKEGFLINIRVPLTEKLVKKYQLPKYKRNNYMLEVLC